MYQYHTLFNFQLNMELLFLFNRAIKSSVPNNIIDRGEYLYGIPYI